MVKPPSNFTNAFKVLQVTASGGATVLLSTFASCYLATVIEKTAHRVQYHFFPHKYKDVDFALGLDLHRKVYSTNNFGQRKTSEMEKEIEMNTDVIEAIDDLRVAQNNSSQWSDNNREVTRRIVDETLFTTATSSSFDEIDSRITQLNHAKQNFDSSQLEQNHEWKRSPTTTPQNRANQNFEEAAFESYKASTHTESAFPLDKTPNSTISLSNSLRDNRVSNERSISSRIRSIMKVVGSSSSESASNVLQSCAMTA